MKTTHTEKRRNHKCLEKDMEDAFDISPLNTLAFAKVDHRSLKAFVSYEITVLCFFGRITIRSVRSLA